MDISLRSGETIGIVGESGSGKSMLVRSIMGISPSAATVDPSSTVVFNGRNVLELRQREAQTFWGREIAMVFQDPLTSLNPIRTIGKQLTDPIRHHLGLSRREAIEHAIEMLDRVRIPSPRARMAEYPHQLSGGMRQRVAIARAFATGSPVLLMDEPLGALDAQTRMLMQEELIALWEQERKTVLMVTHDIDESIILSDRVIVMSGRPGTVREDITIPFERPRSFDIERSPEFGVLRSRIWNLLRDDVRTAEETA